MILIGISGKKQSGKDAVCEHLMKRFPSSERIAFADACKDEVCAMYRITRSYLEEHKSSFRLILQGHGTDYRRRMCGENYWIEQWLKKVSKSLADVVIASDVRFENEARMIHDCGGFLWQVNRPLMEYDDRHCSETELDGYDKFDRVIPNDRLLTHLYQEVDMAIDMFGLHTLTKTQNTK